MLPNRALLLIKEYSKPISKPDWKKGAPHAKLLEKSQAFINLTDMLINIKHYYNHNYNTLFDIHFMHRLLKLPFNILIQNYGETIFNLFLSYKPNQLNFYRWLRLVGHLHVLQNNNYGIPTKIEFK